MSKNIKIFIIIDFCGGGGGRWASDLRPLFTRQAILNTCFTMMALAFEIFGCRKQFCSNFRALKRKQRHYRYALLNTKIKYWMLLVFQREHETASLRYALLPALLLVLLIFLLMLRNLKTLPRFITRSRSMTILIYVSNGGESLHLDYHRIVLFMS